MGAGLEARAGAPVARCSLAMTERERKKREAGQRRDILALIRKFGVERADELKAAGNYGGSEAIKILARDLAKQVKARYDMGDEL
jgi:hypothetical protein